MTRIHDVSKTKPFTRYAVSGVREHVGTIKGVQDGALGWDQRIAPFPDLQKPSRSTASHLCEYGFCKEMEIVNTLYRFRDLDSSRATITR